MSFISKRYPETTSPKKTGVWQEEAVLETHNVEDADVLDWIARQGFAMDNLHEERLDKSPPGAAVHVAAWEGSVRILRWLYAHHADLSQRTTDTQSTPMHFAMSAGHFNAAIFLYKHGCDQTAIASNGKSPVDYAHEYGHLRLMRWSAEVAQGVDWSASSPGQEIQEAALCPVPHAEVKETDAERKERERLEAKALAMEESGLDAENFKGFV